MKAVVFKILTGIITCGGIIISIVESQSALLCFGFLIGGLISYELSDIIAKLNK